MAKRILIVEDDAMIAMLLEQYVELLGFESAACVETTEEALRSISQGGIDAAIVDIHLADGETSDAVAQALATADIPFLVATGGFVGRPAHIWNDRPVLEKPFTLSSLKHAFEGIA